MNDKVQMLGINPHLGRIVGFDLKKIEKNTAASSHFLKPVVSGTWGWLVLPCFFWRKTFLHSDCFALKI